MKLRRVYIIHPFLFGLYPILYLYGKNIKHVSFVETLIPTGLILVFTSLLLPILRVIIRDWRKSSIFITIFFILFFAYGHAHQLLRGLGLFIGRHRYLMPMWLLLFGIMESVVLFVRKQRFFENTTRYLNIAGISLVIISLIQIGWNRSKSIFEEKSPKFSSIISENWEIDSSPSVEVLPDIYYIILDAYMGADLLEERCNFDNSKFINMLKEKGFYVVSKGRSNYAWTSLSLPSSLNMDYIKEGSCVYSIAQFDSRVGRFLKSKGYEIIFIPPPWVGGFIGTLLDTTWAYPFLFFGFLDYPNNNYVRNHILYNFKKISEIPEIEGPKFVFAHIPIPHPPYIFNEEGKPPRFNISTILGNIRSFGEDLWVEIETPQYINQLIFANKMAETIINEILSKSPNPPIIILQGDHGAFLGRPDSPPEELTMRQRLSILNAYYLPQDGKKFLYEDITPVNSFRLVFNIYFGTNYNLLPDESYYSTGDKFIHVPKEG